MAARPPKPVSRREAGRFFPTLRIASITSSAGILFVSPAKAISALIRALTAPIALRLTQGISTSPATGSQTRPSRLLIAIAIASDACSGVPPAISTAAAAAIPDALPTSAWHPPAAPAIMALFAITMPKPLAQNSIWTICSSVRPSLSLIANITPGKVPDEPAVGVAQMIPNEALTSLVAMALSTAISRSSPESVLPR